MTTDRLKAFEVPKKGLSARVFKQDMTREAAPTGRPVGIEVESPVRKSIPFRRAPFYLKIDGLTGPRPEKDKPKT